LENRRKIELCAINAFNDRERFSWSDISKRYSLFYRNLI
jgi:hypothetical protein